ncbi:MCM4 [Symbiodinium sp. KB8]|nr:MCM4 [Symbiodinium sp. KB8]
MCRSMAPSIWELDDVKKGLLLQLFGGANKDLGPHGKSRGEINVLLCGDPGTSKSQLLGYVNKISPRGIYTSGKGSSAVGLTAYVTRDPDTREPVLESGALVLSDRGICCIDEFDKMSDSTRSILHEVMEQQTISVAKAGIICTLNARTSVLASANPLESRYNPRLSVVENVQLPPTLLSRFDLIYLVLDRCDAESDRRLANHIVSLYFDGDERSAVAAAPFSREQLTEYISYAKSQIQPELSDEAKELLVAGYTDMRRQGVLAGGRKVITATPRQLESLIRLAEAHARLFLRTEVVAEDVEEAIRLVNVATQRAATDPSTGTIDLDMIHTGKTAVARDAVAMLKTAVQTWLTNQAFESGHKVSARPALLSHCCLLGSWAHWLLG